MSYYHQGGIRQYVPTYVVKSDYLPTVVHEGHNATTADLVIYLFYILSWEDIKMKKEEEECSLKDPLNSTPTDMSAIAHMSMLASIEFLIMIILAELSEDEYGVKTMI